MTKKVLGLLIVTLMFSVAASAATVSEFCGGATLTNVSVGFPTPFLTGAPVTCAGFTAPVGQTITSEDITVNNDFSSGLGTTTDTVTFTYNLVGFNFSSLTGTNSGVGVSGVPVFTGSAGSSCSIPGAFGNAVAIDCRDNVSATTVGPIGFSVFSTWTAGGLQSNGAETINISAFFTYSVPTVTTPEPATLLMIGGGLIGLALVARRKKRVS
jgi:hypothetical protein